MIFDVIGAGLMVTGVAFIGITALALVRFPDFWTRAHAVAKAETMGLVLVLAGLVVHHRFGPATLKILLIAAFALLVNPTAIHSLARSGARRARADARADGTATEPPIEPSAGTGAGGEAAT